jgi:dienelactone hydrolase
MFGKGKVTTHPKEATAFMEAALANPGATAARFSSALELLKKDPNVNPNKIGAVGYCFGGTVALETARAGAPLDAVVAIHANLSTENPAQPGKVKAQILVLNGEADPMIPATQTDAFKKEMTAAGVKFNVITYPNAKHAFTNPDAGKAGLAALEYNEHADHQSFAELTKFLKAAFAGA